MKTLNLKIMNIGKDKFQLLTIKEDNQVIEYIGKRINVRR